MVRVVDIGITRFANCFNICKLILIKPMLGKRTRDSFNFISKKIGA